MKLDKFKFKITDKENNNVILTFDDLYGYEGEVSGVFIRGNDETSKDRPTKIPSKMQYVALNHNGDLKLDGVNGDLDIQYVPEESALDEYRKRLIHNFYELNVSADITVDELVDDIISDITQLSK